MSIVERLQGGQRARLAIGTVGLAASTWWLVSLSDSLGVGRTIARLAVTAAFVVAGLVAGARRPANPIGLVMIAFGLLHAGEAARLETVLPWRYTAGLVMDSLSLPLLALLVLSFPFGRLGGWWSRCLVGAFFLVTWAWKPFELAWSPPGALCATCPPAGNLLYSAPAPFDLRAFTDTLTDRVEVALIGLGLVTLAVRFVRASPPMRRILAPLLIPVAFLAAKLLADALVLRDRFLTVPGDETITITVPNAVLYVALPIGFLAGVTLASAWRGGVGDLVVALGEPAGAGALRDGLARALRDPSLQIGFWADPLQRYVRADGGPLDIPAEDDRRATTHVAGEKGRLAVLVHDPSLREQPGLLDSATAAARLALENERLKAEVRAQLEEVTRSRTRIVEATDAERRRIERDLHDGAQQRLVGLRLALRVLRDRAQEGADEEEITALIDEADAEVRGAIAGVRDLARGILPSLLGDEGLGAALEALADRAPVRVELGHLPARRLPSSVEVAAYFLCTEGIANVAKHAEADSVQIDIVDADDRLLVTVADDGRGGARLDGGSGLRGLADRVAALGGTLTVTSPGGGGTSVRAEIPLPTAESSTSPISQR